ncbi:HdeD family acid-resistance protein [Dyella sp. 20L07]|uniref:HdeD family acid-resistance protein n=1 Tax=Dyella sp. 20L07 TaxID=3384240 RepID=UPI003D2D06EB
MVRLALLLLGSDFIRRRWLVLAIGGAVWAALGLAIFIDALDGVTYFPTHVFGYLLLVEAVVTLIVSSPQPGTPSVLRKVRGVAFLILGLLIIDSHHAASVILAMAFGVAFLVDGGFRIAAALVVRFRGWWISLLTGVLEVVFAAFMFEPYPTFYAGTVPYCIGMGVFLSGCGLLRQAWRLKRLPDNAALSLLLAQGVDLPDAVLTPELSTTPPGTLIVHVWTPAGSADDVVPSPLVNRYIAAVDAKGVISTGHAALECPPDMYASHYPAVEMDRSTGDFTQMLRATATNNVPGKFQPSYAQEAAGWCESSVEVRFDHYDHGRLLAFWKRYRGDTTYNLTSRNCSSTVAHCLEAALEGALAPQGAGYGSFVRAMLNPELWVAAQLRKRAEAMAWTPGLVLDYARALKAAIHPMPLGWYTLLALPRRLYRYVLMIYRGEPMRSVDAIHDEVNAKPARKRSIE